jgi:hypothetical protein
LNFCFRFPHNHVAIQQTVSEVVLQLLLLCVLCLLYIGVCLCVVCSKYTVELVMTCFVSSMVAPVPFSANQAAVRRECVGLDPECSRIFAAML